MTTSISALLELEPYEPLFGTPTQQAGSAKQLVVEEIPLEWAMRLNALWHSVLPRTGNAMLWSDLRRGYAAVYDHAIYGVAIWTRPMAANRMNHPVDHLAELRRLAIPSYAPRFTATRMLGQMRRHLQQTLPDLCRLLSYQATDVHSGTIYKAANWRPDAISPGTDWTVHSIPGSRGTSNVQNASPKVRWSLQLRSCKV